LAGSENPRVPGSSPGGATTHIKAFGDFSAGSFFVFVYFLCVFANTQRDFARRDGTFQEKTFALRCKIFSCLGQILKNTPVTIVTNETLVTVAFQRLIQFSS
jgi:hypothetical protein